MREIPGVFQSPKRGFFDSKIRDDDEEVDNGKYACFNPLSGAFLILSRSCPGILVNGKAGFNPLSGAFLILSWRQCNYAERKNHRVSIP